MRLFTLIFTIMICGCRFSAAGPVVTTVQECLTEGVLSMTDSCASGDRVAHSTSSYSFSMLLGGFSADVRTDAWGAALPLPLPDGNVDSYVSTTLTMALYSSGPVRPGILNYQFSEYREDFGATNLDVAFQPAVESLVSVDGVQLDFNDPPFGGISTASVLLGVPFDVTLTAIASGGCAGTPCYEWVAQPSIQLSLYDPGSSSNVDVQAVPEPDYLGMLAILAAVSICRPFVRRIVRTSRNTSA